MKKEGDTDWQLIFFYVFNIYANLLLQKNNQIGVSTFTLLMHNSKCDRNGPFYMVILHINYLVTELVT